MIIQTFDNHPSIRRVRGHISQIELFSFNNVNETQMRTEINELNPNKSSRMDDIPANILKESVTLSVLSPKGCYLTILAPGRGTSSLLT